MKQLLLIITNLVLLNAGAFAQTAPLVTYSPATNYVQVGVPFSIIPVNTGGAVPAAVYGQVTTVAGTGTTGYNNATGTAASFNTPESIVGDAAGNLYVADDHNNAIRMITPAGVVTTFAGSDTGIQGDQDGTGTGALFYHPDGIAIDASSNLYVSDGKNGKIKMITPAGVVTTIISGLSGPAGIKFDASGNFIIAEQGANRIIKITPGPAYTKSVIAGSGATGSANGTGLGAQFNFPADLQVDASGNIYVADYLNNEIRKITSAGVVTTFAGKTTAGYANGVGVAAKFNNPTSVVLGSGGILYVTDFVNNDIRAILPNGTVSLVAGSSTQASGTTDGIGPNALFNQPDYIYIDGAGNGYITEYLSSNVRKIVLTGYTIDKPLPAGLTFDQTTGKISGTLTAAIPGTTYTVTAYNTYGYYATLVSLSSYNNWLGNTSDWSTATNWSTNNIPAAGEISQIGILPYTGTAQPDLATNTSVGSVRFGTNNAPTLTIEANKTLTVTNDLTVNAGSAVVINGPGTISLSGTSIIKSSGTLTASLNAVIVLAPSAKLTNNGTFTLASDANGTASISALPASATITGVVNVQRFIKGSTDLSKRGYRLISSAVHTGIDASGSQVHDLKYLTNSVYVSGSGAAANGFNVTTTQNPSLYLFREDVTPPPSNSTIFTTGYNWKGVAKINNVPSYNIGTQAKTTTTNINNATYTIPVGNGLLFFFRGNKTATVLTPPFSAPNDVTLTQTGTLNTGTINVKLWFAGDYNLGNNLSYTASNTPANSGSTSTLTAGFTLVGNPYPATINWEKYKNTNATGAITGGVSSTIYEFNPTTKHFDTYIASNSSDITSQFTATGTSSTIASGNATGAATNFIASGMGFFVQATGTGQTLTFTENAKVNTNGSAAVLNTLMGVPVQAASHPTPFIRLKLVTDAIHNDDIVIRFNNQASNKYVVNEDAIDLGGSGSVEELSSFSGDNIPLAINTVSLPGIQAQVIRLATTATASGTYTLTVPQFLNLPALYQVWLKDAFTRDSVQLKANTSYSFIIDKSNAATFGNNRFTVVIRQVTAYSYRLISFTANRLPNTQKVQTFWKTQNEQNYTNFTVERSTDDGKTFNVVGGVPGTGAGNYSMVDLNPVQGEDIYRLKQEDINNMITYSNPVKVFYSDLSNRDVSNLNVYPNPANSSINLAIRSIPAKSASYNFKFVNSSGLIVKEINSSQPSWQGTISDLKPGTYFVRVYSTKDQSLVARTKFVKL